MNNQRGFTLIELLIYIGVSTIILMSVTGLMFATLSSYAQARIHQSHHITLHTAFKTLRNLTKTTYTVSDQGDVGVDLTTPNTEIIFLGQTNGNNIRLYMSGNVLYAAQGNGGGVALHSPHIPLTSCTVSTFANTTPIVQLTCSAHSMSYFGLPAITTTMSTSFSLLGYAP